MVRFAGLVAVVAGMMVAITAAVASADSVTVDNSQVDSGVGSLGEAAPAYYAQSFTAISGELRSASVFLTSSSGPDGTDFRLLITETTGGTGSGIHPAAVLFESSPLSLPFDGTYPTTLTEFAVDLGELSLTEGATYAIVLDAFSEYDGIDGSAASGLNDDYSEGHFFHYAGSVSSGDRASHFANGSGWNDRLSEDLVFHLTFEKSSGSPAVPLPPAALMGLGLLGLLGAARRMRSRR